MNKASSLALRLEEIQRVIRIIGKSLSQVEYMPFLTLFYNKYWNTETKKESANKISTF
ncbi:hypothetical protein PRIO_5027 [Paenibacillus riograndensis SBR5]|uniref:Uncharacterized protein n=1 Tax=Paenibacillus riograndensis SBR5 TaxID=1073571 RepID=A0A0E4HGD3_9BACL|nr:hypothetical protein PRIO_5027 [Paenibacillus riograndensis SBR5]